MKNRFLETLSRNLLHYAARGPCGSLGMTPEGVGWVAWETPPSNAARLPARCAFGAIPAAHGAAR